ncbi:DUF1818 family protein [Anabaena sp. FACHB-1237]|uniref:DUF1818 family protein n=1 Tax=Anabaena sp. FACHB-1237 TaxID=2692769 RepID=UPI00168119C6|nr:DUF1818 family protein [Anabaena sp. FACHB-1237]MBD2137822.1 DUF1818 family protein [Anabaena sp. FACHB-1237]
MEQLVKSGTGWRVGWNPNAQVFKGLIGTEDWAIELTEAELNDFIRLLQQLVNSIKHLSTELMDEEKIACEAESDLLWMEVEGYSHAYSLRFILLTGRGVEGEWLPESVPQLWQALSTLTVF